MLTEQLIQSYICIFEQANFWIATKSFILCFVEKKKTNFQWPIFRHTENICKIQKKITFDHHAIGSMTKVYGK